MLETIKMNSKTKIDKTESKSSKSTPFIRRKKNESSFSNKADSSPSFIQRQVKDDDKLFPSIGVYLMQSGDKIIGVRVIYIETNTEGLKIEFNRFSPTNIEQIQNDDNFKNFVNSVSIVTIENQLYYQWENKSGEVNRIPIANPKSAVPDGIFNQKEESIFIKLTTPIQI